MNDFFSIKLNKESDVPVYKQLGDGLLYLIESGVIKPSTKLPPIRTMANALKVNSVTVISAYKYLENKKVVYSQMGSGTYVMDIGVKELPTPISSFKTSMESNEFFNISDAVNFANTSIPPALFPVKEFKELFNKVLDRDLGNAFSYTDIQGYEPLRVSICTYVERFGIKTSYDRIQIISGAQQGVDIISKVMLTTGDVLFVEKPTYFGAVGAFMMRGGQVIEVPMEKDGISLEELATLLKIYHPKFIYIMSYYQTPACISYSIEKKRGLLELCAKYDTYIIEEDNQSEFNYSDDTIVPLKALDYKNRVIYIKTFSKILMPGLRIGFMVLPKKILQQVLSAKYTSDIATSGFIQRAFHLYLSDEGFLDHVEMMRALFKERYEYFAYMLTTYLTPYFDFDLPKGGLSFWLKLKNKDLSANLLCENILKRNVVLTPGSVFSLNGEDIPCIRLSFADIETDKIEKGIKIIADYLKELT